ncbi:glycosyltransferase [Rufibacter glacialis]|uniref:Glycosyltransferase n=1 Tax=Rufibacter glacialis TaxID=1259555 RepID=A0A5M8Q9I8_9BACT|nr:glycosyltransferase [Rufibacter glacialis]KAA6431741.1 glycosyltransferase [Rufibacter glacialis]GGK81994.1 glycosyl transferase [Rufibacter glacialis]
MSLLVLFLVVVYAGIVLRCWYAWKTLPEVELNPQTPTTFFTVILPVRNEAHNLLALLRDLEGQQYPAHQFEVLVVDDHSEDGTPDVVRQFQESSDLPLRLLLLSHFPGKRQKKAAVEIGISYAKGDWIACTDGDCRLSPLWLQALNQVRQNQKPKFISGPVVYSPLGTFWERLQALEFSALVGVGAASIALQKPTMCNGANLAYEKAAFYAVEGYAGNEQVPSGDDEFLLHKIHQRFPGQVAFAKAKEALVQTPAAASVTQFVNQRIRWASKWRHYETLSSQMLAVVVLGANVAVMGTLGAALAQTWEWSFFMIVLLLKLGADAVLLNQILGFYHKKKLLSLLWFLQLVYVPYILLSSFLGWKGKYHWKGRQLRTA